MSALTVDLLSATVHDGGDPNAGPRTERVLRSVVRDRLDGDLLDAGLPDGHVCLRKVDVHVRLRDLEDDRMAATWSRALAQAVALAARHDARGVVRYRDDLALLVDIIGEIASGRFDRAWAWHQAGACQPGDPAPRSAPAGAVLAALARYPDLVGPALVTALLRLGVDALARLFDEGSWARVLALLDVGTSTVPPGEAPTPDMRDRADRLLARSAVAERVRLARVPLGAIATRALAVLVVAELEPAWQRHSSWPQLRAALGGRLARLSSRDQPRADDRPSYDSTDPAAATPPAAATAADGDAPSQPYGDPFADVAMGDDGTPATGSTDPVDDEGIAVPAGRTLEEPAQPEPVDEEWADTAWAGLPFLLAVAADVGLPECVLADRALERRSTTWVLRQVGAQLVSASMDDPGVLALSGSAEPVRGSTPPADAAESAALDQLVARWSQACLARLVAASRDPAVDELDVDDPVAAVVRVTHRAGRVSIRRGWCEVQLPAGEADTLVRRAGLDLDPGWVPWLGAVVRYRYV